MLKIGEFSKLTKTTIKTLRYYDEIGLLKPDCIDSINNYRFYSTAQLYQMQRIQSLRQAGLSVDEISQFFITQDKNILYSRKISIEKQIADLYKQARSIDFIMSGECMKNYSATIKQLPECTVYYKQLVAPNFESYMQIIPQIEKTIFDANKNLVRSTPNYCFVKYLENEYKENDICIEYCEAVNCAGNEVDGIKFKKLPSQLAVTVVNKGSYENLPLAYAYVFKWIEDNGYSVVDSPREHYIYGPFNKDNVLDWLTEIKVPVVNKKEKIDEYKRQEIFGGVYGIINKVTNKVTLYHANNIKGCKERFDFAVATNCPTIYLAIQEDWKKYGAQNFEYKLFEQVKRGEETNEEFEKEMKDLEKKWTQFLGNEVSK